jgi:alkanesulfonate monooxygenase SsuD/methylene tetrahydromethanopterin reductase-like flavin-dependent oxidoreductase (luciferase family)
MVGAGGPRLLRLTAELADEWNGGLRSPDEVPDLLAALATACRDMGRDPATIGTSVEALVRTIPAADGSEPEPREIRGAPKEVAAALASYAELGIDHLQIQLRPNTVAAVTAFESVIPALRGGARSPGG